MTISNDAIETFRKEFEAEPNFDKRRQLIELCAQAKLANSGGEVVAWQPIETAPKDCLIDIWIARKDETGVRWADCYYDSICDQWRTSRPSGHLITVAARNVTHWMPIPASPVAPRG